ncbi:MAG: ATP-binding protein [Campylobacterota bacterium]|nr:ATP-binding protein [Campylobacterota bacterium]
MKSLIFSKLDYHPNLIRGMAKAQLMGTIAANFLAPIVVVFVLYGFVPLLYLNIWIALAFILLIIRVVISKRLIYDIDKEKKNLGDKLLISIIASSFTAFLYAIVVWMSFLYSVADINLFVILVVIFTLAAGSLSTLASVFHAFIIFFILMMMPIIVATLIHGGEYYLILSFILSVFFLIHSLAGYKHYIMLRDASTLQDSFKTIFNHTSDGIVLIKKGRFYDCNSAIVSMFGFSLKEDFLSTHIDKFSPKHQSDGENSHRKMIAMMHEVSTEGTASCEWLHHKKDATPFWTEIVLTQIRLDGEDLVYGVWRDIDARKQAEFDLETLNANLEKRVEAEIEKNRLNDQKLLQHSRMAQMGEMISMIAHQWRQPLSAISSTTVNLQLKLELENFDLHTEEGVDACHEYFLQRLENIETYVQNLTHTIDDFRNFYKPNKQAITISLEEVISKSLNVIQASLENDTIKIIQEYDSHMKYELYDSELMQVILNILKNAQDNFKEKSTQNAYIKITTHDKCISICDNGGGISPAIVENIFDPYFSTKDEKNGTGLGLYMSKIIIEEHHKGSLHVSNSDDGVCFSIELGEV